MLGILRLFVVLTFLCPCFAFGQDDVTPSDLAQEELDYTIPTTDLETIHNKLTSLHWNESADSEHKDLYNRLNEVLSSIKQANQMNSSNPQQALEEKQQAYEEAKANEQSTANKTLTALTTAAMGVGGMELARGLSEQKADKDAANDMDAYIATMRCTYADGKQVKAGVEEIELPGGNDQTMMNLRAQYFALAADLKERKEALDLKPGIESEEIIDKTETGLYDDENIGIDSGAYESLYRAQMLGSEKDQEKIDEAAKASKNRVIGGAVAVAAGAVIGIAGNLAINGSKSKKNKVTDIIQERDNVVQESLNDIQFELDRCNQIIKENKEYAASLKNNPNAVNDPVVSKYIETVEKLEPLESINDLNKTKDHPLCK